MFVTIEEIHTHLYEETVTAISGDDETMLAAAITGAQAEARGYLHAFDTDAIFNATGDDRDPLLLIWVKDIAVFHYINIANPAVNYEARERLKGVQKGSIVPDLPVKTTPEGVEENATLFRFGSNPKRSNHI
jgi:hypothetical protein